MPAAKLALGYPYHAIRRLMNAVGPAAAKQLMFTAKSIDAETALRLGLVQEVLPAEELEGRVAELSSLIDSWVAFIGIVGGELHIVDVDQPLDHQQRQRVSVSSPARPEDFSHAGQENSPDRE